MSLDAQRAILGTLLNHPAKLAEMTLPAECFTGPGYAALLVEMRAITEKHGTFDTATLYATHGDTIRDVDSGPPASLAMFPRHMTSAAQAASALRAQTALVMGNHEIQESPGAYRSIVAEVQRRLESIEVAPDAEELPLLSFKEYAELASTEALEWVVPDAIAEGKRVMLVAAEGLGKQLCLTTPIPTPTGWTTMGALVVGDYVLGRDGHPCRVVAATDVDHEPDAYRVVFSDGSWLDADARHQWYTLNVTEREQRLPGAVRTTTEIASTLIARTGTLTPVRNHAVPLADPLELPDVELPVPPYTLGVWLGDGDTVGGGLTLNRKDADEVDALVRAEGFATRFTPSGERHGSRRLRVRGLSAELEAAGVRCHKHIPAVYLRASLSQRRALFAGLMDSDGSISPGGPGRAMCEFITTSPVLAEGFAELARTLGLKVTPKEGVARLNGRDIGPKWRLTFTAPANPFRVTRKASRWFPPRTPRSQFRFIVAVESMPPKPMRCIQVDSHDHTYLAGDQMIPTHNSTVLRQIAVNVAAGVHPFESSMRITPRRTLILDVENDPRTGIRADGTVAPGSPLGIFNAQNRFSPTWDHSRCAVYNPNGFDLRSDADLAGLERAIEQHRPALLCLGPIYQIGVKRGGEDDEQFAGAMQRALDGIRRRHNLALVMEHHAGHGGERDRPFGSSLWLRWPDIGFALVAKKSPGGPADKYEVRHFRGPRYTATGFPTELERGDPRTGFPWRGSGWK